MSARYVVPAPRVSPKDTPLFGQTGSRRVAESAKTERMRDFLRANVRPGAIAKRASLTPRRVHEEYEGKRVLSSEVEHAGLSLVAASSLPRLPDASPLLPRLTPAAGTALRDGASLVETCATAEADGQITATEAAEIRALVERLVRVLGSVVATAEAAAGMRLVSEVRR